MNCSICLEENNINSVKFCCSKYHNNCIIQCLKTTGKCPICRRDYLLYKGRLNQEGFNYTNLDQLKYDIENDNHFCVSSFGTCLQNKIIDYEGRIISLENKLNRRNQIINNKLLQRLETRIRHLENKN